MRAGARRHAGSNPALVHLPTGRVVTVADTKQWGEYLRDAASDCKGATRCVRLNLPGFGSHMGFVSDVLRHDGGSRGEVNEAVREQFSGGGVTF